jgi:phosphate transport system permease protein
MVYGGEQLLYAEEPGAEEEEFLAPGDPPRWSDAKAGRVLGGIVATVVALLIAMLFFVVKEGWPSFAHNGLSWFGSGGNPQDQLQEIFLKGQLPGEAPEYTFHAWPLIWATILIVGGAVITAFISALFVSVFIVEFAPEWMRNVLQPVVRLLASVPSVIYGLLGALVVVPFIGNNFVTESSKQSVAGVITLTGYSLIAGILILTVMIAPLMVAIFSDGLRAVKKGWLEGSLALGINRWRTFWKIAVRTARPAMVAGTVLATARAIGEAVMLAMVTGGVAFAPNPFDGAIFLLEPSKPIAPMIITNIDNLAAQPAKETLFALASVLLVSAAFLSFSGFVAKQAMRKYGGLAA